MDQQERQPRGSAEDRSTNKIDEAKSLASDIANDAKRQGREKLDSGKQTAADQTEKLAGVVERAGQELGNGDQHSLADYAGQLASSMRTFAEKLRGRSIEELLSDTQQLARKNPTLFFIGSIAVGVAVSRFLKSSGERMRADNTDHATQESAVQSVRFEGPPAVSEPASPKPLSAVDSPSFADDFKNGV